MMWLYFSFLFLNAYVNQFSVAGFKHKKLEYYVSNVINNVFNEDDTLVFVFDKDIEVKLPKNINKPYVISSRKYSGMLQLDRTPAYIIHTNQLEGVTTFLLKNGLWIKKFSFTARYLIVTDEQNIPNLHLWFTTFWHLKIYKIIILTYDKKMIYAVKIHTCDPFCQENFCGRQANVVNSKEYALNSSIKYDKVYKNLNLCTIAYYTEREYTLSRLKKFETNLLNMLTTKVNGTFITRYSINDSMEKIMVKQYTVALTSFQEHYGLQWRYDFSNAYMWIKMNFLIQSGGMISPIKTLFVIFKLEVWIMIALAIVVTSLTLWVFLALYKKNVIISELVKVTLEVFSATLWGAFLVVPNRNEARCICICYLIYHIHIQTGFTCNLATILTTPRFDRGITNLEELAESKIQVYAHHSYRDMFFWETKNGSIYNAIKSQMRYIEKTTSTGTMEILKNNSAVLFYGLDVKHFLNASKNEFRVNVFDADIITGTIPMIYGLSIGNFFTGTLNAFLLNIAQSGISAQQVSDLYFGLDLSSSLKEVVPLNLKHLLCAFVFFVIGLVTAAVAFVSEITMENCRLLKRNSI